MTPQDSGLQSPPTRLGPMLMSLGPAVVVSGSVIGSGELINVPIQAARFGFVLFWAVLLSCVIKYLLQVEFGRYCLVHNRTTIQAFNTCPGPRLFGTGWVGALYVLAFSVSLVSTAGILGATAGLLQSVFPLAEDLVRSKNLWAVIITLVTAMILWRGLYRELERLVALLVAGFSLSAVAALVLIQGTPFRFSAGEVLGGLAFSFGDIDRQVAAVAVISFIGALGTGPNELFMYPYWILEKGYARRSGPPESSGWRERTRGWIRVLQVDAASATLLATAITAAYFLLGAAVLHQRVAEQQASPPSGIEVIRQISSVYTESYGSWSYGVFMFGGFCTLFSTLVVTAAATGRMWTDLLASCGALNWENDKARTRCNRVFQTLYLGAFLAITLLVTEAPEKLVILGQYIGGLVNTPLIMFGIVWVAFHTDRRLRMRPLTATLLLTTVAAILGCLAVGLYYQSK